MRSLLRFVPKNHLSFLIGALAGIRLPRPLCGWLNRAFAGLYKVNVRESAKPPSEYLSLREFFIRDLKESARPIAEGIVSPCDGTLRGFGAITDGTIPQVKDKTYSLASLLKDNDRAVQYEQGVFGNFYLSPRDYHHVHAPVSGTIVERRYIPGKLWPATDWAIQNVDDLFPQNERVITYIESEYGCVAVVMVGALNVGKIRLCYEPHFANQTKLFSFARSQPVELMPFDPGIPVQAGERLGSFLLGSSVVVLLERGCVPEHLDFGVLPRSIRFGERLV